jgi:hypothetical protein
MMNMNQDSSFIPGRERITTCMKILENHPELITEVKDRQDFNNLKQTYNMGWYALIGSFPMSFYLTKKMTQDPANASKYVKANTVMSLGIMGFMAYNLWNMSTSESKLV